MGVIVSVHQLKKVFASRTLFDGLTFSISDGERVGLIGPNGAGKSTMMKIIAGRSTPDGGSVSLQRGLRVGYLEQVPDFSLEKTVQDTIAEAAHDPYDWEIISLQQELMSRLELSGRAESKIGELSGGWQKRVALARELLRQPDLLLLDEPTNHLDVETIIWLEDFLAQSKMATLTITHDRVFLQKVSQRIIEVDRRNPNGLLSVNGDYATYLELKESMMAAQSQQETKLRNTLRRETEWIRRGAQARQTKQVARIKAHGELSEKVGELSARNQNAVTRLDFVGMEKNPKKLIEAKGIFKSYGLQEIIPQMDLIISPQTRLGLLGANGAGKSTLIRMLLKTEEPDGGEVTHSERLEVSYFEQNRETLDPEKSVVQTVCPDGDWVDFAGTKVHVRGYLMRFLFSHEQMEMPVGKLSGGEQSRLLLARLMLRKANLLVLDEPTNDLDMATLDVLQDVLKDFNGAVILVTHDRFFMDHVANQILAFSDPQFGKKTIERFADIAQWEEWHESQKLNFANKSKEESRAPSQSRGGSTAKAFTQKMALELEKIELNIQKLEGQVADITQRLELPENFENQSKLQLLTDQMINANADLEKLYERWSELSKTKEGI